MIALAPAKHALPGLLVAWALPWAVAASLPAPWAPGLKQQLAVCVPLLAVLGLPHGATDWWLAAAFLPERLGATRARWWPALFGLFYLLAGLAALAMIYAAPALALALFVAGSVWHFGQHDARAHGMAGPAGWLLCGLPPIAAPLALRASDSAAVLQALGVAATTPFVAAGGTVLLAFAAAAATRLRGAPTGLWRELGALLLLYAVAPPLPAFTGYFCLLHAPRQMAALRVHGRQATVLASAAAASMLIAAPLGLAIHAGRIAPTQAGLQAVFWGLAILTLPHTLCGWLFAASKTPHAQGHPA